MNDLTKAEQTKLDALIADKDMANKVVLLINDEFEIVNKDMFNKMNGQLFVFEEYFNGGIVKDIHYCELLEQFASCATLIYPDDTAHHVDIYLAICIYNGEFEQISLDN